MGTKMAPRYANLFMDRFERGFPDSETTRPLVWLRYIDDIFCVWTGSRPSLDAFLDRLNTRHSTLRFTSEISHAHVEFLDLNIFKGKRFHQRNLLDLSTHLKKKKPFNTSIFPLATPGRSSNTHAPTFRRIKNKFRTHLMLRGYPKNL